MLILWVLNTRKIIFLNFNILCMIKSLTFFHHLKIKDLNTDLRMTEWIAMNGSNLFCSHSFIFALFPLSENRTSIHVPFHPFILRFINSCSFPALHWCSFHPLHSCSLTHASGYNGIQIQGSPKPLDTLVSWCTRGFRGPSWCRKTTIFQMGNAWSWHRFQTRK